MMSAIVQMKGIVFLVVLTLLLQACGVATVPSESQAGAVAGIDEATSDVAATQRPTAAETALATNITAIAAAPTPSGAATASEVPTSPEAEATQIAATETPATAASSEQATVKVVVRPFISFAPFYLAQDEGFFTEQNLNVEFINMTVQSEMIPALASGQIDVASGLHSAGTFNAIAKDGSIQIVADKGYNDPNGCASLALVARRSLLESATLESADSLRGRTLSLPRAGYLDYYAEKLLNQYDLIVEAMQLTDIPAPAQSEALEQGAVDIVANSEPWITIFGRSGHKPILTPLQELLPDAQTAVTLYGPKLLGENADVGNRFMVAYLKAVQQYNEGKTERNIELLAKNLQLEPDLLRDMCWPPLRSDGRIDIDSTMDFQEWAQSKTFLDEVVPAERFWNPSFVDYANEQLSDNPQ